MPGAVSASCSRRQRRRIRRIEIRDYRADSIPLAIIGREKFGTGRRGLNMGDCLSYGAAKRNRARLLYVGEDFALTDVNDSA
jgi:ribonuclease VapC